MEIVIELINPCGDTVVLTHSIQILDAYDITGTITATDSVICEGDMITFTADGQNGIPEYSYSLS